MRARSKRRKPFRMSMGDVWALLGPRPKLDHHLKPTERGSRRHRQNHRQRIFWCKSCAKYGAAV